MLTSTKRISILAASTLLTVVLGACDSPSLASSGQPSPQDEAPAYAAAVRADLARLRAPGMMVVAAGTTWQRDATASDVTGYLERLLVRPAGPRTTYDPLLLNGGSSISASGAPPMSRTVQFNAWTQCSGCSSASTETGGEMSMTLVQGGSYTTSSARYGNLSPYSSGWYVMGLSGVRADASISTVHYAKYASMTYTKRSSAGAPV
jgi:hypothetical protein